MAVNEQELFDNDYSFLNLPASGSAVRSPINIDQSSLPPNIIAAINSVAPIKLPEMDTPLNFDPFDPNVNNEGLIGSQNFSEFLKQIKDEIKAEYDLGVINEDPVAIKEAEDKMVEVIAKEEEIIAPVADPIINPAPVASPVFIPPNIPRLTPQPTPVRVGAPVTRPILADSSLINNELESLNNPTGGMYASNPGIGSNIGIGGGFTGSGSEKTYADYGNPLFSLDSADSALLGLTGPNPAALGNIQSDIASALDNAASVDAYNAANPKSLGSKLKSGAKAYLANLLKSGDAKIALAITGKDVVKNALAGGMEKQTKAAIVERLKAELAKREVDGDSSGSTGQVPGSGAQGLANSKAEGLVSIPGALSAFSINPAAYLYGGAGSSKESSRNEYTESGQYDIDKAARDAEFDAMREQKRIDAGLPYNRLTPEETRQAVKDMHAGIGGDFRDYLNNLGKSNPDTTGAYELGVADRAAAAEAERNQGVSPFMGIPGQGGIRSITRG